MPLDPKEFEQELKDLPGQDTFQEEFDFRVKEIGKFVLVIQQVGFYGGYKVELFYEGDNINTDEPLWEDYIEFFTVRSTGVDKLYNKINTEEDITKLMKLGASDYLHKIAWVY